MKEQSHKEEMSKALRGDFERLRERGVATTLASPGDPRSPEEDGAPGPVAPAADVAETETEPDSEPKPGLLGRLLGR